MTFTGLFQGHESEKRMLRLPESSRLPSVTYFNSMTIDLQLDWFGAMSRPSQQQLGFLLDMHNALHKPESDGDASFATRNTICQQDH